MRWQNIGKSSIVFALMVSIWYGSSAFGQDNAQPESPAPGTPVAQGTPIGGWADWQTMALTDAVTGESFTLADYYGKTVLIQPMATWCSSCRKQQKNILEARKAEGGEEIVVISISVETTLKDEELAKYAKDEAFDWRFTVASPDLLRALVKEFGRALATPPSTPHFLLLPDGAFTDLKTGELSAEEVTEWVKTAPQK